MASIRMKTLAREKSKETAHWSARKHPSELCWMTLQTREGSKTQLSKERRNRSRDPKKKGSNNLVRGEGDTLFKTGHK